MTPRKPADSALLADLRPLSARIDRLESDLAEAYAARLGIWSELTVRRRADPTKGATRKAMADAANVTEAAVGYAFREAAKKAAKADAG